MAYKTKLNNIKGTNLRVGDLRMVKWKDEKYYPAKVIKLDNSGQAVVKYMEDGVVYKTDLKSIKGGSSLQLGDVRMVKWKDNRYYPARVVGCWISRAHVDLKRDGVAQSSSEGGTKCSIPRAHVELKSDGVAQSSSEGGTKCSIPRAHVDLKSDGVARSSSECGAKCSIPRAHVDLKSDGVAQSSSEGGAKCSIPRAHVDLKSDGVARSSSECGAKCSIPRAHVDLKSDDVAQSFSEGGAKCSIPTAHVDLKSDGVARSSLECGAKCSIPRAHVELKSDSVAQSSSEGGAMSSIPRAHVDLKSDGVARSSSECGAKCSIPRAHVELKSDSVAQSSSEGGAKCSIPSAPIDLECGGVANSYSESKIPSAPDDFECSGVAHDMLSLEGRKESKSPSAPADFECAGTKSRIPSSLVDFECDNVAKPSSEGGTESRSPSSSKEIEELENMNLDSPFSKHSSISLYDSGRDPGYIPSDSEEDMFPRTLYKQGILSDLSDDENENRLDDLTISSVSALKRTQIFERSGMIGAEHKRQQTLICAKLSSKKSKPKSTKRIREKDLCFYCNTLVLNFARHLQRHHTHEVDVQEFMAKSPTSKERKILIESIRKKGNYVLNSGQKCVKPVRKGLTLSDDKCLPCVHCLGFFSRKNLYRHRKNCSTNPLMTSGTLSDEQTFLNSHVAVDPKLKNVVFPHMQANEISLIAKRDELICAYGAWYLKTHKGKHGVQVCSRKMQELARLLIEVTKIKPEVKSIIEAVSPDNYETVVQATKNAALYDEETETFKSPKYAINIGKSLRDCCDIAITLALKSKFLRNTTSRNLQKSLDSTINQIKSKWRNDISSQAANLNSNRCNEIPILPLASDTLIKGNHRKKRRILVPWTQEQKKETKSPRAPVDFECGGKMSRIPSFPVDYECNGKISRNPHSPVDFECNSKISRIPRSAVDFECDGTMSRIPSSPVDFDCDDMAKMSLPRSRSPSSSKEIEELENMDLASSFSEHSSITLNDSDKDPEYIPSDSEEDMFPRTLYKQGILSDLSDDEDDNRLDDLTISSVSALKRTQTFERSGMIGAEHKRQQTLICAKPSSKKSKPKSTKRIREKDLCFYCNTLVLNFARHLQRHHTHEVDVQEFMAKCPTSKERKILIESIRKKGNYVLNSGQKCVKPVRKGLTLSDKKCLPCVHCLGFFSRKNLYRHRKNCSKNLLMTSGTLSDAQTFLNSHVAVDPKLKNVVFPHMQANERSLIAKRDELICAYGARYLKTHKGKHGVQVCSRKMQELARLFIEVTKIKPEVKSMIEAVSPENYETVVQATKNAALYDEETETFKSPTYAINIGKSLRDCCDIAITLALKNEFFRNSTSSNLQESLNTTIKKIESNWQNDISSQAANLNINRCNEIPILPLASGTLIKENHRKKRRILVPWTQEQKTVVKDYFKDHIKQKKPPKRHECEQLREETKGLLENKSWLKIKVFVQNIYTKS